MSKSPVKRVLILGLVLIGLSACASASIEPPVNAALYFT